jgi:hypothetical protein
MSATWQLGFFFFFNPAACFVVFLHPQGERRRALSFYRQLPTVRRRKQKNPLSAGNGALDGGSGGALICPSGLKPTGGVYEKKSPGV